MSAPLAAIPYEWRLPDFAGPLDLLLRLIEREELDITAISLALVADQFVAFLAEQPVHDPAILAEFAAIASRLLVLKTRMLFPRLAERQQDAGATADDADDLVRQLQEYRRFKAVADGLASRDRAGERVYASLAAPAHVAAGMTPEITLAPAVSADLVRVVQRRLARLPVPPRLLSLPPRLSIGEMVGRITAQVRSLTAGGLRFSRLTGTLHARADIVTAFMAVLELVRRRRVEVVQEELFGEIVIMPADAACSELDQPGADVAND